MLPVGGFVEPVGGSGVPVGGGVVPVGGGVVPVGGTVVSFGGWVVTVGGGVVPVGGGVVPVGGGGAVCAATIGAAVRIKVASKAPVISCCSYASYTPPLRQLDWYLYRHVAPLPLVGNSKRQIRLTCRKPRVISLLKCGTPRWSRHRQPAASRPSPPRSSSGDPRPCRRR